MYAYSCTPHNVWLPAEDPLHPDLNIGVDGSARAGAICRPQQIVGSCDGLCQCRSLAPKGSGMKVEHRQTERLKRKAPARLPLLTAKLQRLPLLLQERRTSAPSTTLATPCLLCRMALLPR